MLTDPLSEALDVMRDVADQIKRTAGLVNPDAWERQLRREIARLAAYPEALRCEKSFVRHTWRVTRVGNGWFYTDAPVAALHQQPPAAREDGGAYPLGKLGHQLRAEEREDGGEDAG